MRARYLLISAWGILAGFLNPPAARASCDASVPVAHGSTYFACSDLRPVGAFAYQQSDPAGVNSDGVRIAYEANDGVSCVQMSGVSGDGRVTIATDWQLSEMVGCPIGPLGPQRLMIVVAAGDRKSTRLNSSHVR